MNAAGVGIEAVNIMPGEFAELLGLVGAGQINQNSAKKVCGAMFETGRQPGDRAGDGAGAGKHADALAGAVVRLAKYPDEVASTSRQREAVGVADGSGDARDAGQGESGGVEGVADEGVAGLTNRPKTKDQGRRTGCRGRSNHPSLVVGLSSLVSPEESIDVA